jgi:polyphosphate kinase
LLFMTPSPHWGDVFATGPAEQLVMGFERASDRHQVMSASTRPAQIAAHRSRGELDFLAQTLARAADRQAPLAERARLLAEFSHHLDAYFRAQSLPASARLHPVVRSLSSRCDRLLDDEVLPALTAHGMVFPKWVELADSEQDLLHGWFYRFAYPLVTPSVVDATHPFPRIARETVNVCVVLRDRLGGTDRFACVQIPSRLPAFVWLDRGRVISTHTIVAALLGELFRGTEILEQSQFRVTRREIAECRVRGSTASDAVRYRRGEVARLQAQDTMSARSLSILRDSLGAPRDVVYRCRAPLDWAKSIATVAGHHARGTDQPLGVSPDDGGWALATRWSQSW